MPNWNELFTELQREQAVHQFQAQAAINQIRIKYLKQLQAHTGRNVISYYSGWLSKPGLALVEINDEDKNGFMTTIHKLVACTN